MRTQEQQFYYRQNGKKEGTVINTRLKRYYEMLYPSKLEEKEFICLFIVKTDEQGNPALDKDGNEIKFHRYVKNFEQYMECILKYRHNYHIYNALATVKYDRKNELHRREANMRQQRVLFIDFDKKDHENLRSVEEFRQLIKDKLPDLFIHAVYDSGHGYHFYSIVKPTCKIREFSELNKLICQLVGADTNACKVTQVARIPCTYNRKHPDENGEFPIVKEVDHYKKHDNQVAGYHPMDTAFIRRRVENELKKEQFQLESKPLEKWDYSGDGLNLKTYPCLCTEKVLREGADEGERNTWLGRIVSMLRYDGYTESKVREICLDWNTRCRPPKNPNEVKKDIDAYLDHENIYRLNGCWEQIPDERVKKMVQAQCDKLHCMQAVQKKVISIQEDIGVKMSQKLLTDNRLRNDKDISMSGFEYLIMTILYKYIKSGSKTPFTIRNLKMKMQYKIHGKWQLCMDIETFKETLERLVAHRCIELVEPENKSKNSFDLTKIKIKRGLKDLNDKYIEFYYSAARAFIAKQITQNEFKVFLCIVNNIRNGHSCTIEEMDRILHFGKSNIIKAIKNLQSAQCIDVIQNRSDKGNWYNIYSQKHTNKYNDNTCNDGGVIVDNPNTDKVVGIDKSKDDIDITIKLMA